MHLRTVELRNWRSYRSARFDFPAPVGERNVALIRGPNEAGKTSFFEAVVLGLFGRDGLTLVPRARDASADHRADRIRISYSNLLAGILHRRAREQAKPNCAVTLSFEDDHGEPIELTRTWFFGGNGAHRYGDDQLVIFEGRERRPVSAPAAAAADYDEWYREFIARKFLPHHLAEFFLFDGEQVQRYARRAMTAQIKEGIEGLLGLRILRGLMESLESYADRSLRDSVAPSDTKMTEIKEKIENLETQREEQKVAVDNSGAILDNLESEQHDLSQRLGSGGEGTTAEVGDLVKQEERFRNDSYTAFDELMKMLGGDIALSLCGARLRADTMARLRAEKEREEWEITKNRGGEHLDRYLAELSKRMDLLDPPVGTGRATEIIDAASAAWQVLWHPAPEGCPEYYLHFGLRGTPRDRAIERLEEAATQTTADLADLVKRFRSSAARADMAKERRLNLEDTLPEIEPLANRLEKVSEEIGRVRQLRDTASRSYEAAATELAKLQQELGRYVEAANRSAPAVRRARQARNAADLIKGILKEAVPTQVGMVASAMTEAWKSMAQMDDRVDNIEISADCKMRMLNKQGEDVNVIEKSAGANQVFTQALILAITQVSGQEFPFIVDTPLARLSTEHRLGVLRTFPDRPGQVILLSTDEEVVDDKLDVIRHRIASAYQLRMRIEDGITVTKVELEN